MEYKQLVWQQRAFFKTGRTKSVAFRKEMLARMYRWICQHENLILSALHRDLNKSPFEAYATEVGIVKEEIKYALKHFDQWIKPEYVSSPLTQFPSKSFIYPEPYGVVLIMSPWNYPFQLTAAPLLGAICAGNCVIVKPSAYSPNTAKVITAMIDDLFPQKYVAVIQGGRTENQALLNEHFDYIFFTGSVNVGKYVMEKAAAHLTPVSLELGGKSPCIVDETADLKLAARRIIWGKLLNAGQTCVAPDYILVHSRVKDKLIKYMTKMIHKMYGSAPCYNPEYPVIVNEKHFERLCGLMKSEHIVTGGKVRRDSRQIEPTILDRITWESPVMQEEIFGPILPVMSFYDIREVIEVVNARPKPLALYYFTNSKAREAQVLRSISFGGGCINDTVVHVGSSRLPFGGVGSSGMGAYHGKASFDTFTHKKSMIKKSRYIDIPIRYAPFGSKLNLLKRIQ
ncbi:MAG: aldehyde dehydrogenase [Lachnospiraceae bacterium]